MSSTQGRIVRVTFRGFPGSQLGQPEAAEGLVFCNQCQAEVDATLSDPGDEDTSWVDCDCGHAFFAELAP